jgi:hypothetical protein
MKKLGICMAVLVLFVVPLWSQQPEGAPDFLEELRELLEQEDWSPEEIRQLIEQEVDWSQARHQDAELSALCLQYAKDSEDEVGPYEQAHIALAVAVTAREMRALGFGERAIVRTALNGTREALGDVLKLQEQDRKQENAESGSGDLIRNRIRQELQTAMHTEARHMVQTRAKEEKNSRPDELLAPPGPRGPGNPESNSAR